MRLTEIYRCLCDETRLRLLHLLQEGPLCVCHLQAALGLPQAAVSKHLAYLRCRGLVSARRHEQWAVYRLPDRRPRELELQLQCLQACLTAQPVFEKDRQRLAALAPACGRFAGAPVGVPASPHE